MKPGSRVVISGYEHNAVTRPLHGIPDVTLTVVDTPLFQPETMLAEFGQALEAGANAVICTHVSNVFGYRLPVENIAALCRKADVPFVLDASQSAGMLPVSMRKLGAAFIAMPGAQGTVRPAGHRTAAVRPRGCAAAGGWYRLSVPSAAHARGAARPAGGGHP